MKASKLIGKTATITTRDSWAYGDWGVIVLFDGEVYHIAMFGDTDTTLVFERNEFRVRRGQ